MVDAQTPTLADIKNSASETDARALLYIAICEVCDFFNVGKNMNDVQVARTADMIIEQYWHLKLEEIKYCFHRAMRTEKLFDRLDGNIILGWLKKYDEERTEEAMRISDQEATQQINQIVKKPEAITFKDYVANIRKRVESGDKDAEVLLNNIENLPRLPMRSLSPEEKHQHELDFFKWEQSYKNKNK